MSWKHRHGWFRDWTIWQFGFRWDWDAYYRQICLQAGPLEWYWEAFWL